LYCPKCKTEYSKNISECATCGAALVDSSEEAGEQEDDLVPLFRTLNIGLLMVAKSVLESAGISYMVQGEEWLHLYPVSFSGGLFNPSALGVVIKVRREDLPDAQKLLEESVPPPSDSDRNDS
jgi:hypothetical protein